MWQVAGRSKEQQGECKDCYGVAKGSRGVGWLKGMEEEKMCFLSDLKTVFLFGSNHKGNQYNLSV